MTTSHKRTLLATGFRKRTTTTVVEPLFVVSARKHGRGRVLFAWGPEAKFMASTGTSKVVHIHRAVHRRGLQFSRHDGPGYVLHRQITPPGSGVCNALEWNSTGDKLAIVQDSSSTLVLWHTRTGSSEQINISGRFDHLCCVKFSFEGDRLAVGTTRGAMYVYDCNERKTITIRQEKSSKGKVVAGTWSRSENRLAWITEDKHLHCCDAQGCILLHQLLKTSPIPTAISFGALQSDSTHDNILCIQFSSVGSDLAESMSESSSSSSQNSGGSGSGNSKSKRISPLLLHNVDAAAAVATHNHGKGIDLEFCKEYGIPIGHCWDGRGTLLVGFAHGYVCGVVCDAEKIWSEKFCVCVDANLRGITYSAELSTVACCGFDNVWLIRHDVNEIEKEKEKEEKEKEQEKKEGKRKGTEEGKGKDTEAIGGKQTHLEETNTINAPKQRILPIRFKYTDITTSTTTAATQPSSDLDVVQFTKSGSGMMTVSDAAGAIYTFRLGSAVSGKYGVGGPHGDSYLPFGMEVLTTGRTGEVVRLLAAPLPLGYLVTLLTVGFVFVLSSTAWMMESTPWSFCRAVLGWSAFI